MPPFPNQKTETHRVTPGQAVTTEIAGTTGLIRIDNPPVNASSHPVRKGIVDAVEALSKNPAVEVIALYGAGRTFVAGADIKEFGKPWKLPLLGDVCLCLERCEKPVISVLHGTTLGGGLELALGTHFRVGIKGLKVGLPEVLLGVLPGAGGTQRMPRLTGVEKALDLITTGRHIPAGEALEAGLLDLQADGDPREVALDVASQVQSGKRATRRCSDLSVTVDAALIAEWDAKIQEKTPGLFSPLKCVAAVAASGLPLEQGLAEERRLFTQCMESPQRAGLIHAFFAERAVQKIPEAAATPRDIHAVGIIGGGTMGSGIGTSVLMSGLPVTLIERDDAAAAKTRKTIETNLSGGLKRGKLKQARFDEIMSRDLRVSTDFKALSGVDLVIEAVFEEMPVKKEIFAKLDAVCKPGAVLASNTSYLDINEIAAVTKRPQDVIGLHFFSPAHIMRLLEVVVGDETRADVVATGFALAKRLRKVAVRAGVCDGFIGNRILSFYLRAADYLLLDGASFEEIDTALEEFGFSMGPFAVSDLAGLDIGWATRKRRAANRPEQQRYVRISDRICEQGWFGRKTGRGYYVYDGKPYYPNPDAVEIVGTERRRAGINDRRFTKAEIVEFYMTAMIIEAARVVEDGTAQRPIDVDAVFLFGYGFPRHRGGPLHYADRIGAKTLVATIEKFAKDDAFYWQVPAILQNMADTGSTFADLN